MGQKENDLGFFYRKKGTAYTTCWESKAIVL